MGEHGVSDPDGTQLRAFMRLLLGDVQALEKLLEQGRLETGVRRIGAEQTEWMHPGFRLWVRALPAVRARVPGQGAPGG